MTHRKNGLAAPHARRLLIDAFYEHNMMPERARVCITPAPQCHLRAMSHLKLIVAPIARKMKNARAIHPTNGTNQMR